MKFGVFDHMDHAGIPLGQLYADRLPTARSLRPRRPSRLSPRRASLDPARLRRLARAVPRGGSAAHQDIAFRTAGLSVAVLSPAAPDRGNLHARSDERRAPRARRRARRIAVRDQSLWPRLREDRGRSITRPSSSFSRGSHRTSSRSRESTTSSDNVPMILRPVQRPHPPLWYGTTIPENADWPAANDVNIVTIGIASDRARHHRSVSRGARQAREGSCRRSASGRGPPRGGGRHRRGGACGRATRLSALARQLPLVVRTPRRRAADRGALSAHLRRAGRDRQRHRRIASTPYVTSSRPR